MKTISKIFILCILFLIISCKEKDNFQYKIESNQPNESTSSICPQLNMIDSDKKKNIFTAGHFNGSLQPVDMIYMAIEDNEINKVFIYKFSNDFLNYCYTYNNKNELSNIFLEFIVDGDNSFVINLFDCDWGHNTATVTRTIKIKKISGEFYFNILYGTKSQQTNKTQKNTEATLNLYNDILTRNTDNIIMDAIQWIINTGNSTNILDNPEAEATLVKLNTVILIFKEYISNEAFSEPKDGSYSSLSYLTNRLGVKDIDISLDNIDYNYNVTIDARVYPALELASTIWLVQNLRTTVNASNVEIESFNYDDNIQYIGQYGKLYKWNIALDICPTGWHLPTTSEWDELINYYGGFDDALNHLYYEGSSGFNFRYAGFRTPGEFYQGLNDQTMFWCYDEFSSEDAYCYTFTKAGTSITKQTLSKDYALSVRCVRDY